MAQSTTSRGRQLALVTGASSGIGLELARLLEAMHAGKDHVLATSLQVKARAAMAQVTPETIKAEQHRKEAEPGSGK